MYKILNSKAVKRTSDNAVIPIAPGNNDYVEYQKWIAEGNNPANADLESNVFKTTALKARLALEQSGLLASVNAHINTLSEKDKLIWEYSDVIQRDSPLLITSATALGLSDEQVDNLFLLADSL